MKGVADVYPLTPSQLGILYDALRDPDPELYFEQVRFDLVGEVDHDALRAAWDATFEQHPALRTIWLWEGLDDPVQAVREHVDLPWIELDLTADPDPRPALDDLALADRRRGFDLRRPPVSRVTVVRLADDRRHVIWSFHHIMLDGWSTARVVDEVLDRVAGRDVAPSPPFRDHVAWLATQDADAARGHWRNLLDGFEEPTVVAGRRPDTNAPFDRARASISLDEATTRAVTSAARAHRVTVNTVVQAAWALALSCRSGDDDVVFGVTGSGRPPEVAGVESIVGMFLATLPLRVRVRRDTTAADLWHELRDQQFDLTNFQFSSLADIARESSVPAGVPLFDTALIFENFPRPADGGRPFTVEHHDVFEQTRFPVTVMVGAGDRLDALVLYDRARFDETVIDTLLETFRTVLIATTGNPTLPVTRITVMGDDERRRIVDEPNRTDHPVPDSTVHGEIAARAQEHPDAIALVEGTRTMSYAELDRAAASTAAQLVAHDVRRGDAVLLVADRSIGAVVSMLAIMRAGAAYVPVEPTTPRDRLRAVVADAAPKLVVTMPGVDLPDLGLPSLGISQADPPSGDDGPEPDDRVAPDDAMFVVFTSGSTGRPKGVPGSHRAVINRCAWESRTAPYEPGEVTAQKTTYAFVDHVAELWAPLVAGRSVAIIPDAAVRQPSEFVDALARHGVRRIVIVPSLLAVLLEACPDLGDRLPALRRWTVSGEPLEPALAVRFAEALPGATLLNVYGMSEVMADATVQIVTSPESPGETDGDTVPIGVPLDNQRVYVLDRAGRLAPIGVPGEIHVSGAGLMAGYWRRDDLTGERIGPNPFGDGEHARWYRTGDIGRWRSDGRLECLGRLDRQVKIRGVRVELGDIEAALRRLPSVSDAVVVDISDVRSPARLRAYVVATDESDIDDVRQRLTELVPAALVPAEFAPVDAIPLLPSGKVDRTTLANRPIESTAGRTSEAIDDDLGDLVQIWRDVTENSRIGPDDDFFDAGGHSIAAMRLLARVRRRFDVNLGLAVLYDTATPRAMMQRIRKHGERPAGDDAAPRHLVRVSEAPSADRTLYCIHGAGGNVLNLRDLGRALAPAWGLTGIQAAGVDGVTALHTSIDEMCDAYLAAIEAERPDGPVFLAGFSGGGIVAFEMAARLADRGRPVGSLVLLDTFHPSVRGRRRTVREHGNAFLRQGPGYLLERRRVRKERRLYANAPEIVDASTRPDEPVPHELRDAMVVSNTRTLIDGWTPRCFDGPVRLFAAADILDVYDHAGPDRGWSDWAPNLECETVPGGHQDFVLDPHAATLAERLGRVLERALSDATGGPR